jgi:hypothetical protein
MLKRMASMTIVNVYLIQPTSNWFPHLGLLTHWTQHAYIRKLAFNALDGGVQNYLWLSYHKYFLTFLVDNLRIHNFIWLNPIIISN